MNNELSLRDRFSVVFRSFFIQASWNYVGYQNFGFLFSVHKSLRKIYGNGDAFKKAALRNFEIFNTQPYFSCFVMGNVLKMEEAPQTPERDKNIIQIKQSLACAYAAIGDRLFWARLRIINFALTVFLLVLLMNPLNLSGVTKLTFLALLFPTILYAGFSVYIRWKGLEYGYACGGKNSCGLDFMNWNRLIKFSSLVGLGLAASLLTFFAFIFIYSAYDSGFLLMSEHLLFAVFAVLTQRYFRGIKRDLAYPVAAIFAASFIINFLVKI